jgi:outer membrane biogenesis lipoprotein LolB
MLRTKRGEQRRAGLRCWFVAGTAVLVLGSIGACTTVGTPASAPPASPTGASILAPYFSLNGRISVRVNDKVDSGQVRWQRSAGEERIGLYSPLGSQVAELLNDKIAGTATLRQGQGSEITTATSVAALTQSMLGVPLDLDRLAAWVQGVGLRENEATDAKLANGDIWRVTAERFQLSGNHRFASRVVATHADIVVRLVVDEWVPQ